MSIVRLPYRVESNTVETSVRGWNSDSPVANRAMALFDLHSTLTFAEMKRESDLIAMKRNARIEGTVSDVKELETESEKKQEVVVATVDTESNKTEVTTEDQKTEVATEDQKTEVTSEDQKTEVKEELAGTTSDKLTEGTTGSQDWSSQKAKYESLSQTKLAAFVYQKAELFRARNSHFAELIEQDSLLRYFYLLSQEELRKRIEGATRVDETVELKKSISVEEIIPGESFTYTLEIKNVSNSPAESLILYDEFPSGLQFERGSGEGRILSAAGEATTFTASNRDQIAFLTQNEWEDGKIAWHIPGELGPGETVEFRFQATWYWERGVVASATPLRTQPDATAEAVAQLQKGDLALISERVEGDEFLKVSIRHKGSEKRSEGFIPLSAFQPASEIDPLELEKALAQTVYFESNAQS